MYYLKMNIDCSLCKQKVDLVDWKDHCPRCLYKYCSDKGVTMPCFYDCCKGGYMNHSPMIPAGSNLPPSKRKISIPTMPSYKINTASTTTTTSTCTTPSEPIIIEPANPDQLQMKTCFVCNEDKENCIQGLEMRIGDWRHSYNCKKGEWREDAVTMEQRIDYEAAKVFETKDACSLFAARADSNPAIFDLNPQPPASPPATPIITPTPLPLPQVQCDGYEDEVGTRCKTKITSPIIKLATATKDEKVFCKGSHLVRYLVKNLTAVSSKSKKAKTTTPTPTTTTRTRQARHTNN